MSDQKDAIALLINAAAAGKTGPVEIIETHISKVFLAGDRAFKMKRAVKLPYVDFSTPELRLAACRKEVELNAPTAPGLYLGVRLITRRADGRAEFDGHGELLDAVVEMKRFEQSQLFGQIAAAGGLTADLMTRTAQVIARFHANAPIIRSPMIHAKTGAAHLEAVLAINSAGFASSSIFTPKEVAGLDAAFRAALARHAAILNQRETAGRVRRCHGDLHLRNICLLDGQPCLFDCIEFNEQIATIDVLYDLAFLLMDLWHHGFPELANLVINRYLDEPDNEPDNGADNEDGFILLPFFMAVRAAVRAHVLATQIEEDGDPSGALQTEAGAYFALASQFLKEQQPRLIAIGGLSGSGKTTVAQALAAHVGAPPGARIVESDRIRKAMHGVPAETRLPATAYTPEISVRVYQQMARRAGLILAGGGTVVANAVFDRPPDRAGIEQVALTEQACFSGVWLDVSAEIMQRRIGERHGGPSDATVDVLSRQLTKNAGDITWQRLDAERAPSEIVSDILLSG